MAKKLGLNAEAIVTEMQSSDYENLISVFDREFGQYIDLVR
jgi:hypothetical protein